MTLDHKQRRLRHKIHLFVSFLGLLLRETDQKRVIYVNLKKNSETIFENEVLFNILEEIKENLYLDLTLANKENINEVKKN